MPNDAGATHPTPPTAPPTLLCTGSLRLRDPPIFSGTDDKDVDDAGNAFTPDVLRRLTTLSPALASETTTLICYRRYKSSYAPRSLVNSL
ncbi:hypothetical protein HPB52_006621 [Rhipicephalus sanguineus]|uniref:Uncharacterized protein n=1 Tax=Rhipicephalus sanguineus TaxID=34632 RepID=A0A9D4QEV7_RHISA|nr:hypothetical protein HPB52_006621 [Rhipicephalus sanguineus]